MTLQTDGRPDGRGVSQLPRSFFEKRGDNKLFYVNSVDSLASPLRNRFYVKAQSQSLISK